MDRTPAAMTSTPHAAAARAPRTMGTRVRAVLALSAALAVIAPLSASAAAPAVAPATSDAPAVAALDGPPPAAPLEFRLAADADGVVTDDGALAVSLSVDNPTLSTVRGGRVTIAVGREPLASRSQVSAWLDGDSRTAVRRVGTAMVDSIAARGRSIQTTVLELGEDLEPGVYAMRGVYDSAQGPLESRGVFTISDDAGAGQVAVVVPITAGPRSEGLLSAEELEQLTSAGGALRSQLNAVFGTNAILAVDPAIAASIRVLGTNAPESATRWLDDLMALPHTRFALQFGDADIAVQYAAGLDEPLTVEDLTPALDPEGFSAPAVEPSPTPTADESGQPTLPDVQTLTDIGRARSDVFWPAGGTAGAELVTRLGDAGASPAGSLTLVPSDTVRGETGARATAGDADLLVYDADVSRALHAASTSDMIVDRDAALAAATAYAAFADPETPLLVTIDRADARSAAALRSAVRVASGIDGREAVGLDSLTLAPATEVRVDDVEPDTGRASTLERFLKGEADLRQFASILEDPQVLLAPERADILQLLGNAWIDERPAWRDAVATHRAETATTLASVSIIPSPDINLLGSSAPLTFSVRNDLPWPAELVLDTEPNDLRVVVQQSTEVAAGASQTTRVDVPVEARVGSGESSLTLQLRSRTMIPIGDPVDVTISVQAEWEGVGIVVMSAIVSILILLGVVRTVLRLRKRRGARQLAAIDSREKTDA